MDGDFAIGIGRTLKTQTEYVFDGLVRRLDMEGSEEGLFFTQGFLKADGWDFPCGGVDPAVIVVMDFMSQDGLALADLRDVVAYTGADQVVLKPAVRAFNFSFGLSR